jgi:glycerol-3-phosphate cytidylyltransferase-like family protein
MNRQIARAEREYQKAIRMVDQAIAKQRDRLDPELIKQYESSLALLNDSIAASRRALRERPDDPIAGQFLLAAYAKKLDLMQDIAMK